MWDCTARNRGADQADRHILAIQDACSAGANGNRPSRAVDDARPGSRNPTVLPRCVFHRVNDAGPIDVMRILNQRDPRP